MKFLSLRMTASELKMQHEHHVSGSHFFKRSTMKFFGDTMRNYYVPAYCPIITTSSGDKIKCYELQRRHAVKDGLNSSAYFSVETFKRVLPNED